MHDLLAEYGLCCACEGGEGEEGTFLKYAIKYLFALDMKIKSNSNLLHKETTEYTEQVNPNCLNSHAKMPLNESKLDMIDVEMSQAGKNEISSVEKDVVEGVPSTSMSPNKALDSDSVELKGGNQDSSGLCHKFKGGDKASDQLLEGGNELTEDEREELELKIDCALDQCFFCLYGLNIRSDSSYEDELATHRNTSRGDYQTKEQCTDVFQYILPYAKASSVSLSLSLYFSLSCMCSWACAFVLFPFCMLLHP